MAERRRNYGRYSAFLHLPERRAGAERLRFGFLRPVPRRHRLCAEGQEGRKKVFGQARLPAQSRERLGGAEGVAHGRGRGRRHTHGKARAALSGHSRQGKGLDRLARGGLPGIRRIFDDCRIRAKGLARLRQSARRDAPLHKARRRRHDSDIFCAGFLPEAPRVKYC